MSSSKKITFEESAQDDEELVQSGHEAVMTEKKDINKKVHEIEEDSKQTDNYKYVQTLETVEELTESSDNSSNNDDNNVALMEALRTEHSKIININSWAQEMIKQNYKDPILEPKDITDLEMICTNFQQELRVMILAIDILEEFIRFKGNKKMTGNWTLVMATCVLISSKFVGADNVLDAQMVRKYLQRETGVNHKRDLGRKEFEIMSCLNPLSRITIFDDVHCIIEFFMEDDLELAEASKGLTQEILEVVFVNRKQLLTDFGTFVEMNNGPKHFVDMVMRNRFYFPMIVFFSAIRLTKYEGLINLELALDEASEKSNIPGFYWNRMIDMILKMIEQ